MSETVLKVYVHPGARKNEIVGPFRDGIKVNIAAPPVEGRANDALSRFLAKELGIPLSHIELVKGHRSREKILKIRSTHGNGLDFNKKID